MKIQRSASLALSLIVLAGCASPPSGRLTARVTEYGVYDRGNETIRPDSTAPSGQSRGSNGYRLRETIETVQLRLGQSFGFCYEISGFVAGAQPTVVIQTIHPEFAKPGGKPVNSSQFVRSILPVDGVLSDCTGYGFDHSFELVPGRWRFTVVIDGTPVLAQSFVAE